MAGQESHRAEESREEPGEGKDDVDWRHGCHSTDDGNQKVVNHHHPLATKAVRQSRQDEGTNPQAKQVEGLGQRRQVFVITHEVKLSTR